MLEENMYNKQEYVKNTFKKKSKIKNIFLVFECKKGGKECEELVRQSSKKPVSWDLGSRTFIAKIPDIFG